MKEGERMKNLYLIVGILAQLGGYLFLFIHLVTAVFLFVISFLAFLSIFVYLIIERRKEKKEDEENDYRNY